MAPVTIHVSGSSAIYRRAERAALDVDIAEESHSQEDVSAHVTATAKFLQAEIDKLCPRNAEGVIDQNAPVSFYAMTSLATSSRDELDNKRKVVGRLHRATASLDVRFRDFGRLGDIMATLSTVPLVSIRNIRWLLTEETKAKLNAQARKDALRDAIQRATDYAEVIGRTDIEPVEIKDSQNGAYGQYGSMVQQQPQMMQSRQLYNNGESSGSGLNFEPQKVLISASINVQLTAA